MKGNQNATRTFILTHCLVLQVTLRDSPVDTGRCARYTALGSVDAEGACHSPDGPAYVSGFSLTIQYVTEHIRLYAGPATGLRWTSSGAIPPAGMTSLIAHTILFAQHMLRESFHLLACCIWHHA